jgi:flavin-dependent dehydrogenase
LPEVFQLHLALKERSRGWQPLTEPVTTSPLIFHNPQPNRGNVLQAGDTAGFVDPFVGDGISLALRSGRMAAESLLSFFRQETALAAATARYCERYAQELAGVFRASAGIRHMLRLPRRARKPFVFLLEKNPAITRYLVRKTRSSTNG